MPGALGRTPAFCRRCWPPSGASRTLSQGLLLSGSWGFPHRGCLRHSAPRRPAFLLHTQVPTSVLLAHGPPTPNTWTACGLRQWSLLKDEVCGGLQQRPFFWAQDPRGGSQRLYLPILGPLSPPPCAQEATCIDVRTSSTLSGFWGLAHREGPSGGEDSRQEIGPSAPL